MGHLTCAPFADRLADGLLVRGFSPYTLNSRPFTPLSCAMPGLKERTSAVLLLLPSTGQRSLTG